MARHLTPQRPSARSRRRIGLVAATAALLTAGAGLSLPAAWAGPSDGGPACEEGLIPLVDVTVTVNGQSHEAQWLVDHYEEVADALAPLGEVEVTYDPDDDLTTVDVPAGDCSRGFQLEAFSAEGPTWETSGVQEWSDGAGGTMSAEQPSVPLSVEVPGCYHQTDLSSQGTTFEETDYFDGHDADHPVPSPADGIRTPYGLIAAHSGGEGCVSDEVVPQEPALRPGCSGAGVVVVVALDEDLAWSYTLDGGAPVAITRERTTVPVAEDAAYAVVVTATAVGEATIPADAQTQWSFGGVRDCEPEPPTEVVPTAPTAAVDCDLEGGVLVVQVGTDENLVWSVALDGGEPVVVTGSAAVLPVEEDAAYAVVVTAAAVGEATIPADAQTQWSFEGVRDCAEVQGSVTPRPDAAAPVGGGPSDDSLAFTGLETGPVTAAALLLLLGGTGLVLVTRRRPA